MYGDWYTVEKLRTTVWIETRIFRVECSVGGLILSYLILTCHLKD